MASTAARLSALLIFSPSGALITTRAVAPSALAAGNLSPSRSKARCDSVPGSVMLEFAAPVLFAAPAPREPRITAHRSTTSQRRLKANWPILCKKVAMGCETPRGWMRESTADTVRRRYESALWGGGAFVAVPSDGPSALGDQVWRRGSSATTTCMEPGAADSYAHHSLLTNSVLAVSRSREVTRPAPQVQAARAAACTGPVPTGGGAHRPNLSPRVTGRTPSGAAFRAGN